MSGRTASRPPGVRPGQHLPAAAPRGVPAAGRDGGPRLPAPARRRRAATPRRTSRRRRAARTATTSAITTRSTRSSAARRPTRRSPRALAADGPAAHRRLRAEPHGHRHGHERVVERRARERAELAVRALLRHRLDAGQGGAARQAAAADPRRSVRARARARRAAARVRATARSSLRYFDQRAADQPAAGAARATRSAVRAADARRSATDDPHLHEFLSILTSLQNLPPYTEDRRRSASRSGSARRKWRARGWRGSSPSAPAIARARSRRRCGTFNGDARPRRRASTRCTSCSRRRPTGSSYWRTASHEINYRRFFDVNTLAGLRVEDPEVFERDAPAARARCSRDGSVAGRPHRSPGRPVRSGAVLRDAAGPGGARARASSARPTALPPDRPLYVVAEKILSAGEQLPRATGPCTARPATTT